MTATLQAYADRGVFRGFRATPAARGRVEYQFHWMLQCPLQAVFDPRRGVLTFPALFPGVEAGSPLARALDTLVRSRTDPRQPAHKRVDGRKARASRTLVRGDWSLVVSVRGRNHAYAVQRTLNLINELFLALRESWPEYLVERFGLSGE